MTALRTLALCSLFSLCAGLHAQQADAPKAAKVGKSGYYIDPSHLNIAAVLPEPPAVGSPVTKAELAELHRIEKARTPKQAAQAKFDEEHEDIFAYQTVFGPKFTPENLPVLAEIGNHVKNEQSVAGAQLKLYFHRPRPYQTDKTLHPVCTLKEIPDSYPSGHSLTGYLEGFTLAEMIPEKRAEILARADDYAHNRLVCGVHHPSDTEASRKVAYIVFGYMLATPKFQHDIIAGSEEIRAKLGLPAQPAAN